MTNERFTEFFDKYQQGTLSAAERQELDEWISQSEFNRETFERITNEDTLKQALNEEANARINNWTKIVKEYPELFSEPAAVVAMYKERFGRIRRYVAVAASLLVIALAGAYLWLRPVKKQPEEIVATPKEIKNDVLPDTKNALLTLDDGTTIVLDSAQNGMLATQGGMSVVKKANGQLVYEGSPLATDNSPLAYNKITVPKGSDVVFITLADGSKVWMNAASSIRYPTTFTGNDRKVEITGEAYFAVTQSVTASGTKQSFIVQKGEMQVQVLGTSFNVNTYEEEGNIKVTLLEGSVRVKLEVGGQKPEVLKPGQQAIVADKNISVKQDPNLEEVMAWKNGKFVFDNTGLEMIMRQIERWYDVEVVYQDDNLKKLEFDGEISRYNNASRVLGLLQETGDVHFKIEGKKVLLSQ